MDWERSTEIAYDVPVAKRPFGTLVVLPYHTVPMWPREVVNPIYDMYLCVCVYCNHLAGDLVQICLDFGEESWSVRVICQRCKPDVIATTSYCGYVLTVQERIAAIINQSFLVCSVCGRKNCKDVKCDGARAFLKRTPIEEFLETMHVNKVDILSCLRFSTCHNMNCERPRDGKTHICGICRRVEYCSEQCKRAARKTHQMYCEPYENLWLI